MFTDFYVADLSDADAIASGTPSIRPRLSTRNADNAVLADLWAALDPDADVGPLRGDACVAASRAEGPWVFALPIGLIDGLADSSEVSIPSICENWCRGEEMAFHKVPSEVMHRPLQDLIQVAAEAKGAGKIVLLAVSV